MGKVIYSCDCEVFYKRQLCSSARLPSCPKTSQKDAVEPLAVEPNSRNRRTNHRHMAASGATTYTVVAPKISFCIEYAYDCIGIHTREGRNERQKPEPAASSGFGSGARNLPTYTFVTNFSLAYRLAFANIYTYIYIYITA